MFLLIGEQENIYQNSIDDNFTSHPSEEILAKFTTKDKAEEYVKQNTLKTPRRGWCCQYPYYTKSLLCNCNSYRIEEETKKFIPINPK